MKSTHQFCLLAGVALSVLSQTAAAQSTYSIPNPIMKPASFGAGAGGQGGPAGAPVPRSDTPVAQVPPLPPAISSASLPGQTSYGSAPTNETVIRDTLATFTVTAIVGNRAVLRNNVGGFANHIDTGANRNGNTNGNPGNGSVGMNPGGSANGQPQVLPRQAVIRVKSDVSVYVAGVELTPTVLESRVEFRIVGKKAIVSTVTLESQSSYGYVPLTAQREVADPAVGARVSPVLTNAGVRPADGGVAGGNGSGAAPQPNGYSQSPR